jgi:hypothetical protein
MGAQIICRIHTQVYVVEKCLLAPHILYHFSRSVRSETQS